MMKRKTYTRHKLDFVSEEMMAALLEKTSFDFNDLFKTVHARLRARNAASGGEEMLRLRTYEKLQVLVTQGLVRKEGKNYTAAKDALRARSQAMKVAKAAAEQRRGAMLHVE